MTVSVSDIIIPKEKKEYIEEAEQGDSEDRAGSTAAVSSPKRNARKTPSRVWTETTDKVTKALESNLDEFNPINMMAQLGRPRQHQPDPSAGRHARPDG